MPIHVKYPNQLEVIEGLRSRGYSDDQIESYFRDFAKKQRLNGYSNHELATFWGVSPKELAILLYLNERVSPLKFFEVATPDAWIKNSLKYAFYRVTKIPFAVRMTLCFILMIVFANLYALRKGYPITESVTFLFLKRKRAIEVYKISQISQVDQEEIGNTSAKILKR